MKLLNRKYVFKKRGNMQYRILHVEDLSSDAGLAEREISKVFNDYTIKVVETESDFVSELDVFNPHLVISDFMLPTFDGMRALKIVLEKSPNTPVIILTGSMNEDTAVNCMKAGASDYVIKEHIKRLGSSVLNALEQKEIKLEQKKALQQIKLLSTSVEKSPVMVVVTDPKGNLEYVNSKFTELTGYSANQVLGKNMRFFKTGKQPPEFYEELWNTILSGKDWKGEMQNKRKNGELYWESVAISSILNEEGAIAHFISIKEDVTEKKRLFEELIIAKNKAEESDRLKTAFLHNISHEIRTPLNGITGFTQIVVNSNISDEKRAEYGKIIGDCSKQLISIVDDIISFSIIEAGQEKVNNTECSIDSILGYIKDQNTEQAITKNLSFTIFSELADKNISVFTDKTKLFQILNNLVSNALKFTSKGFIKVNCRLDNNFIVFSVADSGIGILPDMHKEIFKRFRQVETSNTRQFGGSGLGLSISKAYVELLGGKIWLESEINNGSTFFFTIPFNQVPEIDITENQIDDAISFELSDTKILLIAEDEDSNFILLEELLSNTNIRILRAVNGVEAVEICKSRQNIDLILMDLKMPVMDGYEATKQIKGFSPNIPIIAQTAYTNVKDRNKAFDCGCSDFISKPYKIERLLSKIRKQLLK